MKTWDEMNDVEKRKLLTYEKYLKLESSTVLATEERLELTKYCVINDLCVTEIPELTFFDITYQIMARHMDSQTFDALEIGKTFVDENNNIVDVDKFRHSRNENF